MHPALIIAAVAAVTFAQQAEPAISKDAISVHAIRRGTMPLREIATGSITSIDPAAASISTLQPTPAGALRTGQTFSVQIVIRAPQLISGTIGRVVQNGSGTITADIAFRESLPEGTLVGAKVGALVDVGEARDIVFFERPADARPNTESTIFVIEPDGAYAKRVAVKYGRQSGALMEILSGLSPGDRVIVTDMSAFVGRDRVRLK
jgi:multidrug efflux pump subunit AcrA (membrane-fusion protein)